jgi:hypothetical protein
VRQTNIAAASNAHSISISCISRPGNLEEVDDGERVRHDVDLDDKSINVIVEKVLAALVDRLTGTARQPNQRPTTKEKQEWGDAKGCVSSDHTRTDASGESLWSRQEAKDILGSIRRKPKRDR